MLRSIREGTQGTTGKILLAIIIVPFVFIGGMEFLRDGAGEEALTINGEAVTEQQVLQEFFRLRNEVANSMGEQLDPEAISEERLMPAARQRITDRVLVTQALSEGGVAIPDEVIQQAIVSTPQFQVEGKFSEEFMLQQLAGSGVSVDELRQLIRDSEQSRQLRVGLLASAFYTDAEADILRAVLGEERVVDWTRLEADSVRQQVEISDDELAEFYESIKQDYFTELSVNAEYISLRLSDFFEPVDEQDIVDAYEEEKNNFTSAEQRDVAHILLEISDERDEEQTRALASELLEKLNAGESFAALAEQYSDDSGSAREGGSLGLIEQDETFPAEFEDAAFALEQGAVSDLVETDAGIHLITVADIIKEEFPSLEEQRDFITQQLQRSAARKVFVEQAELLADESYNSADLLAPANALGLSVVSVPDVTRAGLTAEASAFADQAAYQQAAEIFASPAVLSRLFAAEVFEEGNNSETIELSGEHTVVVRVASVEEPRQQSLDEVRTEVSGQLVAKKAGEILSERASSFESDINSGRPFGEVFNDREINLDVALTRSSVDLSNDFGAEIFRLPRSEQGSSLQKFVSVSGDVYLYTLKSVGESTEDLGVDDAVFVQQGTLLTGQSALTGFLSNLRDRADIEEF